LAGIIPGSMVEVIIIRIVTTPYRITLTIKGAQVLSEDERYGIGKALNREQGRLINKNVTQRGVTLFPKNKRN